MPEDRFGDLDPAERRRREGSQRDEADPGTDRDRPRRAPGEEGMERREPGAAGRLSELDEDSGEGAESEGAGEPPPARTGPRYAWVVGVAAFLVIVVAAVNTLPNAGRGREGPTPGEVLPDFAAPSVLGESEGDANVRQASGGSEEEGAVPACDVQDGDVVNVCDLRERPLVITFVAPGCEDALDRVERMRRDFPGVSFVGVIIGESRDDAAEMLASHEWGFPVALDPDRAVFNLYRAADCPTTVTAEAGGEVVETLNGPLTGEQLRAAAREVATERRGAA